MLSRNERFHERIKKYGVSNLFHRLNPELEELKFNEPDKSKAWEKFKKQVSRVPKGSGLLKDPVLFLQVLKILNISNEEYLQGKKLDKKAVELTNCEVKVELSGIAEITNNIRYIRERVSPKKRTIISESNFMKELRALIFCDSIRNIRNLLAVGRFQKMKKYTNYGEEYNQNTYQNPRECYIKILFNGTHHVNETGDYRFLFPMIHRQHTRFEQLLSLKNCPILPLLVFYQHYFNPNMFYDIMGSYTLIPLPLLHIDIIVSLYFTCCYFLDYLNILKKAGAEKSTAIEVLSLIKEEFENYSYNEMNYFCLNNVDFFIEDSFFMSVKGIIDILDEMIIFTEDKMGRETRLFMEKHYNPYYILFPNHLKMNDSNRMKTAANYKYLNSSYFPYYTNRGFPNDPNHIIASLVKVNVPENTDELVDILRPFFDSLANFFSQFSIFPKIKKRNNNSSV